MYRTLIIFVLILLPLYTYANVEDAYKRSYSYEKRQDYENAIKSIMPVYKQYPMGYTVNLRLGWLFYLKKAYANSISHYNKAIQALPVSVPPKLGYTLPLIAQQKWAQAEQVLNQILKSDYYNYLANVRLSYVLRMQGKFELAARVSQKMLTFYPIDTTFLAEFALSKIALGDTEGAKLILNDILILDPENITARSILKK